MKVNLLRAALFVLVAPATVAAPAVVVGASPAVAQAATGTVTVVHGLRGVVADVYIDGQVALPAFQPDRVTDPIAVPAGPHHIEVRVAGQPASSPPAAAADVTVVANGRQSIVAHLDSSGNPAITAYDDDVSAVPAGQARAIIRHTADAGPVDVAFDSTTVVSALAEPGSTETTVAPAAYTVSVYTPGTHDALFAPEPASLAEGSATIMYLIGGQQAGTLSWIAEQVTNLATPPTKIQTGDSGLAADAPQRSVAPIVAGAVAGVGAAAVALALTLTTARRRSRPA